MRIVVMPMLGKPQEERTRSLVACHAIFERQVAKQVSSPKEFDAAIGSAVKELLLADRASAIGGNAYFIVRLET
jgi:hypothetical protein